MCNISSKPGISDDVLNMLKGKANNDPAKYSRCVIMLDGMSIRKHVDWDPVQQQMVGFVDVGTGSLENTDEATEVLVIMAVGLQSHWKVPVGYFLINGIAAEMQSEILISAIVSLYEHAAVTVVALVMDGHTTNQRMVSVLGCSFQIGNFKTNFAHPCDNMKKIHIFFYACHLLKNLRGALHALREITFQGNTARWEDIVHLQDLQVSEGLRAANKLTMKHIHIMKQKMNVRLAAQTFSSSVASALLYVQELGLLENCSGTSKFLSAIDRLFDIFNSRCPVAQGFKGPLRKENFTSVKCFLSETRSLLLNMTDMTGKKVCEGKRQIGVLGFVFNIDSLICLAHELLFQPSPVLHYLLTYKLSQDHLETFFSAVRQRGGWNNNPSAQQFKSAYRALLSHAGVLGTGSRNGNCMPQDTTSLLSIVNSAEGETPLPVLTFDRALHDHIYSGSEGSLSLFVEGVLEYISGWVVRKVCEKVSCKDCACSLVAPSTNLSSCSASLLKLKNKGGLVVPSASTLQIVRHCELVLRSSVNIKRVHCGKWEQIVVCKMMMDLPDGLFPELKQHFIETAKDFQTHEYVLISMICKQFIHVRRYHTINLTNRTLTGQSIRHSSNKNVLFLHQ